MKRFTCERCGETFESDWTDESANAEMLATFGELPKEDQAVVCDECYASIMQAMANQGTKH